jgi:hypothetical protein
MGKAAVIGLAGALLGGSSVAEERMAMVSIYALEPHREGEFTRGYQEHLRWHVEARDPLPWYVWRIASGERQGDFAGATIGHPWAALGSRPRPAEDRADHQRTIDPHVARAWSRFVVLRPDLGGTLPELETATQVLVIEIELAPAARNAFEKGLRSRPAPPRAHGWAEVRSGGALAAYLLFVPVSGPAAMEGLRLETFAEPVLPLLARSRAETWAFRPDLSTCRLAESRCLGVVPLP